MGGPGIRSRNGCLTCKKRKVKCDEVHPVCSGCVSHRFSCEWPPLIAVDGRTRSAKPRHERLSARHPRQSGDWALATRRPSSRERLLLALPVTEPKIRCRNSLMLAPQDKQCLQFFPSTTVFAHYDFGEASCLRYLAQELAPSNSIVMNMVLAISASEMHRLGLHHGGSDRGLRHYSLAMEDLRVVLGRGADVGPKLGVEVLLVSIFLMLNYEFHYSTSPDRIRAHLAGLWALVRSNVLFLQQDATSEHHGEDSEAANLSMCCQIIVWSIYLDISMTISGASESLLTRLAGSPSPLFDPRRLCANARLTNLLVWKHQYSSQQRLRDADFARPMEFGFQVLSARFHIWEWEANGKSSSDAENQPSSWFNCLLELQKVYSDLLFVADTSDEISWGVSTEIIVRLVAFFWATIIFYYRVTGDREVAEVSRQKAATDLARLLFIHSMKVSDKRHQVRIVWPIFIAAIETTDLIHKSWLLSKLRDCRELTSEGRWLYLKAEEILGQGTTITT